MDGVRERKKLRACKKSRVNKINRNFTDKGHTETNKLDVTSQNETAAEKKNLVATEVDDEFDGSKYSSINLDVLEEEQNDVDLEEEQNDIDLDKIEWLTELKREFSELKGRKCRYTQIQFYLKLPTLKKMDLTHLKSHYERYKYLESMHDPRDNTAAVLSAEKKAKKCIPMKRKF